MFIILGKQLQYTFKNDTLIQLSLSLHFYLLHLVHLLLNSCGGNEAKHNVFSSSSPIIIISLLLNIFIHQITGSKQ